jgi:hypothetical protein
MTPEARAQAERVRAWVAGEWGEEPAWLDNHRAANSEAREGRVTVAAILSTCHGWGPTRTGHAIGCDHSTVLHHLGKLADGRYPDVADMVADYRREHRRARKAG